MEISPVHAFTNVFMKQIIGALSDPTNNAFCFFPVEVIESDRVAAM